MLPERYLIIAAGMHALLEEAKAQSDPACEKLAAMLDIYLGRNGNYYEEPESRKIRAALAAVISKFHQSNLALEQLWALGHARRDELTDNALLRHGELDTDQLVLITFVLEGFLFQARAFLDLFMKFTCLVLKAGDLGYASKDKFYKQLQRVSEPPYSGKAQEVLHYFDMKVFGEPKWYGMNRLDWGSRLQSIRDKVAHYGQIEQVFGASEVIADGVRFDWPTIEGETYDRFCQFMQNGVFAMLQDLAPVLFDLEWKPGRYRPGMW